MKLKDSTFAIIAEKKDSISHKWFNDNLINQFEKTDWTIGHVFEFEAGRYRTAWTSVPLDYEHKIYTESEFEALLKAEQENEATQTFGGMTSTGENAQTFPKNTVFGKENIAHKSVFNPNGFVKPFKGVAITKSEAEKILRDKFKLPDYVEFKIVE